MKDGALQELYDDLFLRAKAIVEDGEEHSPMILIFGEEEDGGFAIAAKPILAMMGNDDEKNRTAALIRKLVEICPQDACVVFITEAWMQPLKRGEELPKDGRIADKSKAVECVIFQFHGKDWQAMATCPVDHKARKLEKGNIMGGQFGGRFSTQDDRKVVH
jgi:hypothetical protein